jgi:hypothetical protein
MRVSGEVEFARYELHENSLVNSGYRAFLERFIFPIENAIFPGMRGLDYGSGREENMRELLSQRGISIQSYDLYFSPNKITLCRSYDFILCSETCEHFREPFLEFHRLVSLLKNGAWLALQTQFVPENFADWHYHRDQTHIAFFSEKTFRWLASSLGLSLVYCSNPVVVFKKA